MSIRFAILEADDPVMRSQWMERWRARGREPFAHPAFLQLFARAEDRVIAAVADLSSTSVLFPLVLRPIPGHPGSVDLSGPYGYGGAYCDAALVSPAEASSFWNLLGEWARSANAVTLFSRLHLFPDEILVPHQDECVDRAPNIVRTLQLADEELLSNFEHKVRKNLRRASREGVTVEFDTTGEGFDSFSGIYEHTMTRRGAADTYLFPTSFFDSIQEQMAGSFVYAHARHGSEVISSELVLLAERHAYSFLGGTLESHFHVRPNDLLKVEIMRWCRSRGLVDFVLGGGASPHDGIERFKRSFAPEGIRTFATMQSVLDEPRYQEMKGDSKIEFFPAYRAPNVQGAP